MTKNNRLRRMAQLCIPKRIEVCIAVLAVSLPASIWTASGASPSGDTIVYHAAGKNRVHVIGCRRLTRDPKELAKMEKMTLAEAVAKGWPLCSRCPGSTTTGKGNPAGQLDSWVNPPRDEVRRAEFRPDEHAPLVSFNTAGKLAYTPYTKNGDRIIDFSYCGYMRSEVPIPDVRVVETLTPPDGPAKTQDTMAYPVGPDSFKTVQSALDRVGRMRADADGFRGAVLLSRGKWHIESPLLIPSGVVLRGEGNGENGTILIFTIPSGSATGIQLGRGGGTSVKTATPLSGRLTKRVLKNGASNYILTLEDGFPVEIRRPKFKVDYDIDNYVGKRVTVRLPLLTTIQGNETWKHLKHNMPYAIQVLKAGEKAPPREPGLDFSEDSANQDMPESRIVNAYVPTGATEITLENADAFKVGDYVNVVKTTNEKWIELLGVGERLRHIRGGKEGKGKKPWGPQAYHHFRRITAIHGAAITLDIMLPQSIEAVHGGGLVKKLSPPMGDRQCGVEHLRVMSNYDTTVKDTRKSANFRNLKNGIGMNCRDSWVRNCTVMHVWYAAVALGQSQYSTVRDCISLQPIGPKRGGKRYTYSISGGTGLLVYACYAENGRHDFAVGARTMGPNAFVRCTALRGGQSEPHHRWGVGSLYDSITMKETGSLAAINRGDSGSGHGWAAANTVFWNCAAENIVVYDPETRGENNFAIGYTGPAKQHYSTNGLKYANTRAGYWGTPKEGVFYGYALMGNGYIESPDKPVKPDSLFIQQLIERIGPKKAMRVLE